MSCRQAFLLLIFIFVSRNIYAQTGRHHYLKAGGYYNFFNFERAGLNENMGYNVSLEYEKLFKKKESFSYGIRLDYLY